MMCDLCCVLLCVGVVVCCLVLLLFDVVCLWLLCGFGMFVVRCCSLVASCCRLSRVVVGCLLYCVCVDQWLCLFCVCCC